MSGMEGTHDILSSAPRLPRNAGVALPTIQVRPTIRRSATPRSVSPEMVSTEVASELRSEVELLRSELRSLRAEISDPKLAVKKQMYGHHVTHTGATNSPTTTLGLLPMDETGHFSENAEILRQELSRGLSDDL